MDAEGRAFWGMRDDVGDVRTRLDVDGAGWTIGVRRHRRQQQSADAERE
jgi:hypothetical protein